MPGKILGPKILKQSYWVQTKFLSEKILCPKKDFDREKFTVLKNILGPKKSFALKKMLVYNLISSQKPVLKNIHCVPKYQAKCARIQAAKPNFQIYQCFGQYPGTKWIFSKTNFFVEIPNMSAMNRINRKKNWDNYYQAFQKVCFYFFPHTLIGNIVFGITLKHFFLCLHKY